MNELVSASGAEAAYLQRADNLIFRFKKQVANDGEVIFYELRESQLEQDIYFNTVYFDCHMQMEVFKNGITSPINCIGRQKVHFKDIQFGSYHALTLNEEDHNLGTIFLKCQYLPLDA